MTAPTPSFLDFFVLEAGEYVEQLDALLLKAGTAAPDADAFQRTARALRGSATMAKLTMFAELASTLEALGRGMKQGAVPYSPALRGALTGAVDDLKILVRAARAWSATEDQLAIRRIGELSPYAGTQPSYATAVAATAASSAPYFAAESTNVAAALEQVAGRPSDKAAALAVLQRVRALRGVAGVREVPALSETAEAAESALRPLEMDAAALPGDNVGVLRAAADLLRGIASGLASGQAVNATTPQYRTFLSALDAMLANEGGADRVIPIAELYYDDAGPHVVSQSPNPPTTPAQRFRMEVVSLGEHLHKVIDDARNAADDIQREHAKGGLGRALRAIRATASSFDQAAVARTVEGYLEQTGDLSAAALDAVSRFAATISPATVVPTPATSAVGLRMTHVRGAVAALGSPQGGAAPPAPPRPASAAPIAPAAPTAPTAPAAPAAPLRPAPAPQPQAAGASAAIAASLDASIAAFDSIASEHFAEPALLGDDVIPMDALFYRGRAALDRAIELRDSLRKAGGPPAPEVLEEIYDLLDLARAAEPAF